EYGCHGMRCAAGRELMYFDRGGNAYPCPRSNVTAAARIGHYADEDFGARGDETNRALDAAMTVPAECGRCPAQGVCDYGCHAFNVAEGGFFAVNCDASKEVYGWVVEHLEVAARVFLNDRWRDSVRATGDTGAVRSGVELPSSLVWGLAEQLRLGLARFLARPHLDAAVLARRFRPQGEIIPLTVVEAPSAAAARCAVTVGERRSG
ncbi:MAG: SPASM domain-containing protein, partial [Dehalococcoidia bacterium]